MNLDPSKDQPAPSGKVLDLGSFRKKKETESEFGRDRQPLFASHLDSQTPSTAGRKSTKKADADFGDRLNRIRSSLDKINRLMAELKKLSAMNPAEADRTSTDRTSRPLS